MDEIHRELYIKDQFSEPHNQQQNPVESLAIRSLSQHVYVLLDRTGAPDAAWYLAAAYLADIHNHLSNDNLPNKISPIQYRTGVTPDISPFLQYTFWQPILYLDHESSWPSTTERPGYWVGVAHNIGDILTYWIYDDQTKHVLARSVIRPLHVHANQRVNWDPVFASHKSKRSAQHGGDIKPPSTVIQDMLDHSQDFYDHLKPTLPSPKQLREQQATSLEDIMSKTPKPPYLHQIRTYMTQVTPN